MKPHVVTLQRPVFVVSLRRCHERRRWMQEHLGSLGIAFEFEDAVDGFELAEDRSVPLTRGEVAVTMSHLNVWRRLLRSAAQGAFVFEDDVMMLPWCSLEVLGEVAACARPTDVVLLQCVVRGLWRWGRKRLKSATAVVAYAIDDTLLAGAYFLTREAAAAMVRRVERGDSVLCGSLVCPQPVAAELAEHSCGAGASAGCVCSTGEVWF
ncbi:MAG: glycosyltransferase family 25 protein [Verrucomicrobiae bacterium]|nr:glycosyltransferase family 25 protein [Verrucomicrobiae bacterium]